jgi:hypothetical protein
MPYNGGYNTLQQIAIKGAAADTVSLREILQLSTQRNLLPAQPDMFIGDRAIHLFRQSGGVSLCIFEGGHESIVPAVIPLIAKGSAFRSKLLKILSV